jgi:hypothetical protein
MIWMIAALAASSGQAIYEDRAQDVIVRFAQSPEGEAQFSAYLPAGWTFKVQVDGNQDGNWGVGSGPPRSMAATADRTYGQDNRGGIYCSQYIYTAQPNDPTETYASSECGELLSKGHVELSGLDAKTRATITIKLPANELFGALPSAKVRVCVWDTARWSCQHSLANPLILSRQ